MNGKTPLLQKWRVGIFVNIRPTPLDQLFEVVRQFSEARDFAREGFVVDLDIWTKTQHFSLHVEGPEAFPRETAYIGLLRIAELSWRGNAVDSLQVITVLT